MGTRNFEEQHIKAMNALARLEQASLKASTPTFTSELRPIPIAIPSVEKATQIEGPRDEGLANLNISRLSEEVRQVIESVVSRGDQAELAELQTAALPAPARRRRGSEVGRRST